ncbi:hypothetical protein NOLU111490_17635 [Novosphingobium lubricantis]
MAWFYAAEWPTFAPPLTRAHAITKPFAHLGNCSLRAGGTVYLDDQLAPCQFHIGKNRRAVIHGRDEGPLAFGRLRLLVLRLWCQPVPETVAGRFQPLCRVQPSDQALADHAFRQRKNDTVEHQVIAVGVDHIRRAAGHGLAQTVEQPHVREHRSRCSQKRVPIGRVQFRSVLSFVGKSGKCLDHSHGALSAERQQRSGNAMAPVHVDNPCGDLVPVDQGLGCTVFAHRHRSNVAQQIAQGHRLTRHDFADLIERHDRIA